MILVTGNLGYVGASLTSHLTNRGHQVAGLDTGYFLHCISDRNKLPETSLTVQHFADLRSFSDSIFDGVSTVIHLAALSNDPMGKTFEEPTRQINIAASVDLAKRAKRNGVKSFVFSSSCSVYGTALKRPRDETAPLEPLTAYARSKVDFETALREIASDM